MSPMIGRRARVLGFAVAVAILGMAPPGSAQWATDEWLQQPVDNAAFASFLEFFAYDHQLPFALTSLDEQQAEGVSIEHLSFESTPGMRVTGRLYRLPTPTDERRPAMVFLHGGVPEGKDGLTRYAAALARAGWAVLTVDLLHFGERDTGLFETFMNPEKAERLYNRPTEYLEWVTQVVKDVGRSYDMLVAERGADARRIVLVGISRGGQLALIAGGADRRFAGVAALIAGHFDALETGHRAPACPANYLGRISPRPLLTLNGDRDGDYDRRLSVEPLHRLAGQPHEARWHDLGHTAPVELTVTTLIEWLSRVPPRTR